MESSLAWHPTGFYTFGSQNSENAASLQLGGLELDITHLQQFIITLCVSLAAYAILAKLCWLQLRAPSDHYDWYPIVVSFLLIQLFAIAKEVRTKILYAGRGRLAIVHCPFVFRNS